MNLPPGITEQDAIAAIDRVADVLGRKFNFPDMDRSDVEQEVRLEALLLLGKGTYDPARPLRPYLYHHCERRLQNRVRDKLFRRDAPCARCAVGDFCSPGGTPCEAFARFRQRNTTKSHIFRPMAIASVNADQERGLCLSNGVERSAAAAEVLALIDTRLDLELRSNYLRMRAGVLIPKHKRSRVLKAIAAILAEAGLTVDGLGLTDGDMEVEQEVRV